MPVVTGNVATFGLESASLIGAQLLFVPPTPGVTGSYLLSSKPVPAVIATDGSGSFTVTLQDTTTIRPTVDGGGKPWAYSIRLTWLDSGANYVGMDLPDFHVFVPPAGGPIGPMLNAPILATQVWITDDGTIPALARAGDLLFNKLTNHLGRLA